MNVFHRYTRQALRKNRSRTWVTIVGIILSVALFTAVTEGAYSGVQYLIGAAEYTVGRFHGCYQSITEQQASQLSRDDKEITEKSAWQLVGWGQVGADNAYKPYLRLMSMDPDLPDLLSIRLTQGRLPEKAGEILLPEHLWSNGSVRHALGDTMELELGHRTLDGEELAADDPYTKGETLTDTTSHTYTVVGFYQRLDMTTEPFSCPGYTALTCQEQGYQTDEFFRVAHPSRFYSYMEGNAEKYPGLAWYSNSDLLNYYGATTFFSVNRMIYSFAVILLLMISFGSVSLIYNSFSISVAERTRQFGILKSIGATRKQIRDSVLYEALVLCAVGIPLGLLVGCLGIGITLYCLRDSFGFLMGESGNALQMHFVLSGWDSWPPPTAWNRVSTPPTATPACTLPRRTWIRTTGRTPGWRETAAPPCTSSGMRISGSCCGTTACRRRITSVPMHLRRWRGICWTSGAAPRAVSTISSTITTC